jgi:lipoprotein-anchoring transpeptidase ErfK/SrfK
MKVSRLLFAAISVGFAVGLSGCAVVSPTTPNSFAFDPPVQQPKNPSAVQLTLSTGAQRLYVVEGDNVLLATPVTVGTASAPTPHGNYTIYLKVANRRRQSSPGAGYPMTYWMEFKPAYGLHWGFVKPYPSTHGCVRMPIDAARKTFQLVRVGTPIHIARSQPWDSTIGKTLPVLDDSKLPDPPMSYMLSPSVFADASRGNVWKY